MTLKEPKLDDINQSVIYIPYSPPDDDIEESAYDTIPNAIHRDLPDGPELRLEVYKKAWNQCLARVKSILQSLHTPVTKRVVQHVRSAYLDILPGLPYPEIPVVEITGASPSLLNDVVRQLDFPEGEAGTSYLIHLYPAESSNMTAVMKALITGFTSKGVDGLEGGKRRPTTSLAVFDIQLLVAWYRAVKKLHDGPPLLIVMMHDFEQFNVNLVQDMLYICSLNITDLPLVFIFSLSTPRSPSYLQASFLRSTLALIRVSSVVVASGEPVLEEIVLKTFFALDFDAPVMIGPASLEFLVDYFTRHNQSLDAVISILQLVYMKHFEEPLSALLYTTPEIDSASPFISSLLTRLQVPPPPPAPAPTDHATSWRSANPETILEAVDHAREAFESRIRRMKVGFGLLRCVRKALVGLGLRSAAGGEGKGIGVLKECVIVLRGKGIGDVKYLGTMIKKLSSVQLDILLKELRGYYQGMPDEVRQEEAESFSIISDIDEPMADDNEAPTATSIGEWFSDYLRECLSMLETAPLWDIWYTGVSPAPSELINPSTRASIISGLVVPFEFVEPSTPVRSKEHDLWELSDTSILFARYSESGRMINVYDWYDSFAVVLEDQRRHLSAAQKAVRGKKGPKGKGKVKDEEEWKVEVHARFIRGLHELDWMGFLKHTGRKADHVIRTAFDIVD